MSSDPAAPGARILARWRRLSGVPGGAALFSRLIGTMVPYTGSLRARVERLEPGFARVRLDDRRHVRNHLKSIHAVALTNLGELATGLATLTALPAGVQAIVVRLCTDYHAKARGRLEAEARVRTPEGGSLDEREIQAVAEIRNGDGITVATVTATWRLRDRR